MRVLVLNAGALHAGYLGCYGCEWVPTPNLDRLAAAGVVFDRHYADCPRRPSRVNGPQRSAWTGRPLPPFSAEPAGVPGASLCALLEGGRIPGRTIAIADWQAKHLADPLQVLGRDGRALVWVDLPTLAPPWTISPDDLEPFTFAAGEVAPVTPWPDPPIGPLGDDDVLRQRLQGTYAAVVAQFDDWLGALFENLENRRLYDETLVVLTADCGLALGEHGVIGPHRAWMHEEVWHIPLIVKLPSGAAAGSRIAGLTQPVDLFATILEALDLGSLRDFRSLPNLWPLIREEVHELRPHAYGALQIGDSMECALRTPDWSFLLPVRVPEGDPPRGPRLYVKPDDRWEANDVRQHHIDLAEQMEKTLRELVSQDGVGNPSGEGETHGA